MSQPQPGPLPLASDPVTAVYNTAVAALIVSEQVADLIRRLSDHQRTLEDAEAERRKQSDRLWPTPPAE